MGEEASSELPRLVDFLLNEHGDEKFASMATHALLRSERDLVLARDLPPMIALLARFADPSDMTDEQAARFERSLITLPRLFEHVAASLDGEIGNPGRAAAILWSDQFDQLLDLARSEHDLDRMLVALADLPGVEADALWRDASPAVRAALIIGHGPSCPTWPGSAVEDDLSPEVRAAAKDMADAWRYDEPGCDYRCQCARPEPAVDRAERSPHMEMSETGSRSDQDGIDDLYSALASALLVVKAEQGSVTTLLEQRLVMFLALANGASHARDRARMLELPVNAYNDCMVNHDLGGLIAGALWNLEPTSLTGTEIRLACDLGLVLVWLAADTLRTDLDGDWLKRIDSALIALSDLDIAVEEAIDDAMADHAVSWPSWMLGRNAD